MSHHSMKLFFYLVSVLYCLVTSWMVCEYGHHRCSRSRILYKFLDISTVWTVPVNFQIVYARESVVFSELSCHHTSTWFLFWIKRLSDATVS